MNLKSTLFSALLVITPCLTAFAQDDGQPDSLVMEFTPLLVGTADSTFVASLYMYNDVNDVASMSIGFKWDNPNVQMDSANWSPEATASFNFIRFLYVSGNLAKTNTQQKFQAGGSRISGNGMLANSARHLVATYYFHVKNLDANTCVIIDTNMFSGGTVMKFVRTDLQSYIPVWAGKVEIGNCVVANNPPVLAPIGAQSIAEGTTLSLGVSASDTDLDAITFTASPMPAGAGFVDNGDGTADFNWTPSFNQAGIFNITFVASDGTDADSELVVVTVMDVNQVPVLTTIATQGVDEGANLNFSVAATDPDGNTPALSTGPLPSGAQFTDNGNGTGSFNWTPGFDQAGSYSVIFLASDGVAADSQTVAISVVDVNRAPVLTPIGPQTTEAVVAFSLAVSGSDPDGTTPGLNTGPLPTGATFGDNGDGTGSFDWTPSSSQAGVHNVIFYASDGSLADSEVVAITVNPPANRSPQLSPIGAKGTSENVNMAFGLSATDPDGTTPTLSNSGVPTGASFVDFGDGTAAFDWTPNFTQAGIYNITFFASDGFLADTEVVQITVDEVGNQAPVLAAIGAKLTDENQLLSFGLSASDPDGTVPALNTGILPSGASFTDNGDGTASLSWKPDFTQAGTYSVIFFASDSLVADSEVVLITVNQVNLPPNMQPIPDQSTTIGTQLQFTVTATDVDGTIPALTVDSLPTGAMFTDNTDGTGLFDWTPAAGQEGLYDIKFTATDDSLALFSQTIQITVLRPPSADSVWVGNVPAVPGARATLPISFNNSCTLEAAFLALTYDSVYLHLDSVSFSAGALATWTNVVDVTNPGLILITSAVDGATSVAQSSGSLWGNLHFTALCESPAGTYPIDLNTAMATPPVRFSRNCGAGVGDEIPEFFAGSVIIDTTANYVCGYVVEPDGTEIVGATVELHADFPFSMAMATTTSSAIGSWSFSDFTIVPFDVYAYASGYYPADVQDLTFGEKGVKIVLTPIESIVPTSQWVDYYCDVNTYFGAPLPVGSVVEARTPSNLLVGQFTVKTSGQYGFMPVYRASDQFNDDGARSGDVISFFINGDKAVANGNVTYPADFAEMQVCLDGGAVVTKNCDLVEGWNLVSWNVDTPIDGILDVLGVHMACIEVVLGFEGGGLTYDPTLPVFSTLHFVDHLSGYWVKVKPGCTVSLAIEGVPVPVATPIATQTGWNLVSYLPEDTLSPAVGLASLDPNLLYAYGWNNGIQIYQPGANGFNTLTELTTCNGYWLKMAAAATLVYPGGPPITVAGHPEYRGNPQAMAAARQQPNPEATPNWVNLYAANLKLDGELVSSGSKIRANSVAGDEQVGRFEMSSDGRFGFMPVYASIEGHTGLKAGDEFYLVIGDVETVERFTWTANGDRIEVGSLSSSSGGNDLPVSYALHQNYPNPFNPSTVISFSLPKSGQVKLEVFNLLGELIAIPLEGEAMSGENEVVWNGRNLAGHTVASGIYFYRLTAGSFVEARKMLLLK